MTNNIMKISKLNKSYHQGNSSIKVLNDLELDVKKGQTISVIGQSGSGKSTFLSLLGGLDNPDSGSIEINGHDITKMGENELAIFRGKSLGIVFQQFHLIPHLTALENIMLPLEINKIDSPFDKAMQAIQNVGLEHRINHYPSQLSGGEQQRVAIARSFVVKPLVLLADEPSGNLDSQTGHQIMDLLFDLVEKQNMTMILVTHNHELAGQCHQHFKLESGILIPQ